MATLYRVPTQNAVSYALDTQLAAGGSSLTLNQSVAGVVQAPGVIVIDRVDSNGTRTPTKREYVSFTGVSGANLTGLTRGLAGSTDQVHTVGAVVEITPDIVQEEAKYQVFITEHNTTGQHTAITASSASIFVANVRDLSVASTASLFNGRLTNLVVASAASTSIVHVATHLNVSGASVTGLSTTGGFNALFQVPGALASQANVAGLIPVPAALTIGFIQAYVQTPASLASVSAFLLKNNAAVGVVSILAGATYASSASLTSTALAAGDELRLDIRSTASLASDLSVLVRAS